MIFFLPDLVALKGKGKDRPRTTDHEGPKEWGGEGIGVEVSLYYFFRVGNATPRPLYSQERDPVTIV